MFKQNRLAYFETPSVEVVAQMTAPEGEFGNLYKLLTDLHGEAKARQELANIASRTTTECQKVGATSMDQTELVARIRQIARKELESARKGVLARLGERVQGVADVARRGVAVETGTEAAALPVQVGNRVFKIGEMVDGVEYAGWRVYLRWDPRVGYCLAPSDYLPVSDHYIPLGKQPGRAIEKLIKQQAPALARAEAAATSEALLRQQVAKAMSEFNRATEEALAIEEARLTALVRNTLNDNPSLRAHYRTNDVVREITNGVRRELTQTYLEAQNTKDVAKIAQAQKKTVDMVKGMGESRFRGFFRSMGVSLPESVGGAAAVPKPPVVPRGTETVARGTKVLLEGGREIIVQPIKFGDRFVEVGTVIDGFSVEGIGLAPGARYQLVYSERTGYKAVAMVAGNNPPTVVLGNTVEEAQRMLVSLNRPMPVPNIPGTPRRAPTPHEPAAPRVPEAPKAPAAPKPPATPQVRPGVVPEAPVTPSNVARVSPYANASEAEIMAALARGEKIVEATDLARLGWSIKTGVQNGRVLNILVKGEKILQVGGKVLTVAGKVLVPLGIAIECLVIGYDIYTLHGILKNEAVNVREWKRANNMPNPDSVSTSDLIDFTEAGRAMSFEANRERNQEEYEAASKNVTFLGKSHAALVAAKGILHDISILESTLSQHNISGWDYLNPGKLIGEGLATADARNQELTRKADEFRNGAAHMRSLMGQINEMQHTLPHTKGIVVTALERTSLLADSVANAAEHFDVLPSVNNPAGINSQVQTALSLVEADARIAREKKKKNAPAPQPKSPVS